MEHRKHLEELNTAALQKIDDYMKTKNINDEVHKEKLDAAKNKWQASWNEFLETLMVLERLEI